MGREAFAGLTPLAEATVESTNAKEHGSTKSRKKSDHGDDVWVSNPEISDFMNALGDKDNTNIHHETTMRPGAVLVQPSSSDPDPDMHLEVNDDGTAIPIVAHLAPNVADVEALLEDRWATRMARELEERTRQQITPLVNDDDIVVMPDESKYVRTHPGQTRQRKWMMAVLFLLFIVGGVVTFLLLRDKDDNQVDASEAPLSQSDAPSEHTSDAPSFSPVPVDPLVEELRSWIGPTRDDLLRFLDPTSPQSQALAWLKDDPITLTPGRSTRTVLERYVLGVLYYSTSGPSWIVDYLSDEDICTWNIGGGTANNSLPLLGVYCVENGESIGTLAFSGSYLRGTLPWELSLLTNLEVLDFGLNSLTGSIPTRIIHLSNLQVMFVQNNELTGSIPADINKLTRLEVFWASTNRLKGTLPATFSPFTVEIELGGNSLTGSIPESWGTTMPGLDYILLQENTLTGSLPSTLAQLSNLHDLFLYSNLLTGPLLATFPSSISTIFFDSNAFTGSIPSSWGDTMPNLWFLSLIDNSLTGMIPSSLFAGMVLLEYFAAGNNFLSGPLPSSFPASVTHIYLNDNAFTGSIPSTWGDSLPNLWTLAIHGNSLTGSIPLSLGLITLLTFTFQSNSLTGSVDFLCDMGNGTVLVLEADCPLPITCSCCTTCFDP